MNDLELLRKFEPILSFTQGEVFYPCAIEDYVRQCSLWVRLQNGKSRLLVPRGKLEVDVLASMGDAPPGQMHYLRFVDEPLTGLEYQRWLHTTGRNRFRAPGRLARVGLGPRVVDAIFSLSLLARGTVPGGTAAAAMEQYLSVARLGGPFPYYGRVVRTGGYVVLHYLYFYMMNDWRSSFDGANDHEADWEQIIIYLDENGCADPRPAWLALGSHDFSGDDLRRRWDDPDLTIRGDHPVIFVAAGSHSAYFLPGEYLHPVELKYVRPLLNTVHTIDRLWRNTLQQGPPQRLAQRVEGFLSVPFVDYARGDGVSIGPGQALSCTLCPISDQMAWIDGYRGLWGLDARDPFAGESAPAGPKYNRNGTIRLSWHNPLGWSGLNKVAPPHSAPDIIRAQICALSEEIDEVEESIDKLRAVLPRLELETRALQHARHLGRLRASRAAELRDQAGELNSLHQRRADLLDTIDACERYLLRLEQGDPGDPQAHIRFLRRPQTEREIRQGNLAELWSAFSIGLLLFGLVVVVFLGVGGLPVALVLIFGTFIAIEATFHRRLEKLLLDLTIILAVICAGVLLVEFFRYAILIVVASIAALVIADNFRELRRR